MHSDLVEDILIKLEKGLTSYRRDDVIPLIFIYFVAGLDYIMSAQYLFLDTFFSDP